MSIKMAINLHLHVIVCYECIFQNSGSLRHYLVQYRVRFVDVTRECIVEMNFKLSLFNAYTGLSPELNAERRINRHRDQM